jgi:hypothetical protein
MPRSFPTPADPPQPHPNGCFISASGTLKPSPSASLLLTRLYQASESAVSLTACVIPCVRFSRFVRLLTSPPHGCNTRYEWLVSPYSTGTFTQPETPSFAWRTSVPISPPTAISVSPWCNGFWSFHHHGGTENTEGVKNLKSGQLPTGADHNPAGRSGKCGKLRVSLLLRCV